MAKYGAFGTIFKRVGATIANVRDVSGPGMSADTIDVTSHDSAGGWREFVAGLLDGGEVTFELAFDPDDAGHVNLRNDVSSRASRAYSVTFTDGTPAVASFNGLVTGFEPSEPVDGALTASVTVKVTGAVTWA